MPEKYSTSIEDFLAFLRDSATQRHIAEADSKQADDETQDILHRLELCDDSYYDTARLAKELRTVRRNRRVAKDKYDTSALVDNWAQENAGVIKSLERLLGAIRKVEDSQANRIYWNRTDVVQHASLKVETRKTIK